MSWLMFFSPDTPLKLYSPAKPHFQAYHHPHRELHNVAGAIQRGILPECFFPNGKNPIFLTISYRMSSVKNFQKKDFSPMSPCASQRRKHSRISRRNEPKECFKDMLLLQHWTVSDAYLDFNKFLLYVINSHEISSQVTTKVFFHEAVPWRSMRD